MTLCKPHPPAKDREGTGDQECVAAPGYSACVSKAADTTITISFFNVKSVLRAMVSQKTEQN